jgi:hypothetical protein
MIAHVAEASEASGRVLLWLDPGAISMPQTVDAAVRIAAAYAAEIETVVIDGPTAADITDIPTAHVSFLGKTGRILSFLAPGPDARARLAERQRREVEAVGARARVPVSHASAGGNAIDRLAEMCLARGPWNIVAVSTPPSENLPSVLGSVLANVSGATGVVVAGRRVDMLGPNIAVVIEDGERMPSMLRAAERLNAGRGKIQVMIAAETVSQYEELDGLVRLATSHMRNCVFHKGGPDFGVTGTYDEMLFRMRPNFVIARFGGTLLGEPRTLSRLLAVTPAPFLLVR